MSKTIINIKTLNINLPAGARQGSDISPAMIGMLVHSALCSADHTESSPAPSTGEAPAAAPAADVQAEANVAQRPDPTPELIRANVLAFLRSDDRYSKRTLGAIAKHFNGGVPEVDKFLCDMVDDGELHTSTRRRDGATLYEAA